jgi:indoleamine 2,3-dioxygenase
MRAYMPPPHRRFVAALEAGPDIGAFVDAHHTPALAAAYNGCIDALTEFRKQHMEIAVRYITMQSPERGEAKGTGGTSFALLLGTAKRETRERRME